MLQAPPPRHAAVGFFFFPPPAQTHPALKHTHQATTRLRKNAAYFKINYALLTAGITAATVALNPAALIVLAALSAAWTWLTAIRTSPVVINGRTLSERETVLAASAASVVVVFFLTSAGTVLFSALGLSAAAVAAHGALRAPDDLFTDEPVEAPGGLLGMLTGGLGAARPVAAAV